MNRELVTLRDAQAPAIDLVGAFLAARSPRTLRAYSGDLADFARFAGAASAQAAVAGLLALAPGDANGVALAYRTALTGRGLSPATVARRLAALRSVVKLAKMLGRVDWTLSVEAPKVETYRDTSGPGRDGWDELLAVARRRAPTPGRPGKRDLAILRLLHDLGLRRAEVVALDLGDVDLMKGQVQVRGKGKLQDAPLSLPAPTRAALADWIAHRPGGPGPLFVRLDNGARRADGRRLTGDGLYKIVAELGKAAGLRRPVRPHGLRHQAITQALDATGGDVRAVQRFSRHASPATLLRYDDNRRDLAGDVAKRIAGD
jgi:integrase/recombinase XerC